MGLERKTYVLSTKNSDGKRVRLFYKTKKERDAAKREIKLKRLGIEDHIEPRTVSTAPANVKRTKLKDAINVYTNTVSMATKSVDNRVNEKLYFTVLYDDLTDNFLGEDKQQRLTFVDQVELLHLQQLRSRLVTVPQHNRCKKKRECDGKENSCRAKVLTPSTANRYFNCYRDFFRQCKVWKFHFENPLDDLRDLPIQAEKRKIMPDEMIQDVLDVAPKWAKGPWFLMVATGARPIELKRLEWRDVDFSKRVLRYWSLKGDGSLRERWVAMPSNVLEFAQAQFDQARRDFRAQPGSPVFVTPTGKRLNSKSLARLLRRITTELGIDGYVAYGFRHRFVTRGRRQGMDTADVGKIVGHSSANTTSGYDHTDAEDLREMMEKVNRGNPKLRG